MFRNVTLKCLTEIAGVSVNQYEEQFVNLFTLTMMQLKQVKNYTPLSASHVMMEIGTIIYANWKHEPDHEAFVFLIDRCCL